MFVYIDLGRGVIDYVRNTNRTTVTEMMEQFFCCFFFYLETKKRKYNIKLRILVSRIFLVQRELCLAQKSKSSFLSKKKNILKIPDWLLELRFVVYFSEKQMRKQILTNFVFGDILTLKYNKT